MPHIELPFASSLLSAFVLFEFSGEDLIFLPCDGFSTLEMFVLLGSEKLEGSFT